MLCIHPSTNWMCNTFVCSDATTALLRPPGNAVVCATLYAYITFFSPRQDHGSRTCGSRFADFQTLGSYLHALTKHCWRVFSTRPTSGTPAPLPPLLHAALHAALLAPVPCTGTCHLRLPPRDFRLQPLNPATSMLLCVYTLLQCLTFPPVVAFW